jgi:hypothetical protein
MNTIFSKKFFLIFGGLMLLIGLSGFLFLKSLPKNSPLFDFFLKNVKNTSSVNKDVLTKDNNFIPDSFWKKWHSKPTTDSTEQLSYPKPDIKKMKNKGCVADGLLSGYSGTSKDIKLAKKSKCYFFSRAIETWLEAPDFRKAVKNMEKIGKKDVLYGMFIAEAIDKKEKYIYYDEGRRFDFKKMCKKNSKNFWGEHTCKPSFAEKEYRDYLKQITHEAMDIGIQVFLFGQVYHQEKDLDKPMIQKVLKDMRKYAKQKNMEIVIGAQTNNIDDEEYLRLFDFIEGGVGLHPDGSVEDGPCFSRWYNQQTGEGWCWALMWNKRWKNKANNVFVHFDWNGKKGDDMSTFALMSESLRHRTLQRLHRKFTAQDVGFLLPLTAPLPKDNGGCHGPRKRFYSASMKYGCKDLDVINEILR